MQQEEIKIINITVDDLVIVLWLFEQAMEFQGKNGYKVWEKIDQLFLQREIDEGLQFKIVKNENILCIFSVQYNDPLIWRDRDRQDAIYLHRIVVSPNFKGQKQFQHVLNWAKQYSRETNLKYVRMDTWTENKKIIDYYQSFGFQFVENYKTTYAAALPLQNRNLELALLELELDSKRSQE